MAHSGRAPLLMALLAALSGGVACGADGVDAGHAAEAPPITVELLKVEPQLLRDTATFSGQLDAEYSVELKAETSGVIESVLFEEGQSVKKGTVLFKLRDDEQRARLNEAVANRNLAQEVWDRTQQLVSRDAAEWTGIAISMPVDDIKRRMKELPRRREIIAYCRGPYCLMSYDAVHLLRKKGLKARRMQDGLPEWRLASLPTASD